MIAILLYLIVALFHNLAQLNLWTQHPIISQIFQCREVVVFQDKFRMTISQEQKFTY